MTFRSLHNVIVLAALMTLHQRAIAGKWDWGELTPDKNAFCEQYMPHALALRETQGPEAALAEIERIYQLAEQRFDDTYFFHRVVWYEAQIKGGHDDEKWGTTVYEYLWDRDMRTHPEYTVRLPGNQYLLLGNIGSCYQQLGKAAEARKIRMQEESYLIMQKGLDTSGQSYPDMGPIFTFLPQARKRAFPIYEHELPMRYQEPTIYTKEDFIYYSYLYAICRVAGCARDSGDWIKAAELSTWGIRYADEYMKGNNHMKGEIGRALAYDSHKLLSDLALFHGYHEEAADFLRIFIDKAEGYYDIGEWDILLAKLKLAVIRIDTEGATEDDLAMANEAEKQIIGNKWNDRVSMWGASLDKALIYHALDHKKEAWEIVDALMAEAAEDVNPHHWILTLDTAIDLALEDGAARPELEEWLVVALENARRAGNKYKELPLYEKYAKFLMIKGRYEEAVRIQQEAVRLARAMSLPKRLLDNLDVLEDMRQRIANETQVASSEPQPETDPCSFATEDRQPVDAGNSATGGLSASVPPVDIQPRISVSAALPGQAAYGRFYIHNPATVTQQGTLQLSGSLGEPDWMNGQWLTVSASPTFETIQLSRPLELEAGVSCIIDIIGMPHTNGTVTVDCQWIADDRSISGSWTYQTSYTGKRTAVIDAHEYRDNPFYLVPIHHMVQRIDADAEETIDFTIEASSPMRIESYDALTGELLAVDANGDGDFLDQGDQIMVDDNRNSWPDLVFEAEQRLASLVMYVQPAESTAGDIELSVSIRTDAEWQMDAVDFIKASNR